MKTLVDRYARTFAPLFAVALVAYGLLIGYLSLRYFEDVPPEEKPAIEAYGAFFLHLIAYAVFAVIACLVDFCKGPCANLKARWLLPGIMAYSGLLELLQGLTGYREASWSDFIANGLGLVAGLLLFWLVAKAVKRLG